MYQPLVFSFHVGLCIMLYFEIKAKRILRIKFNKREERKDFHFFSWSVFLSPVPSVSDGIRCS